MRKKRLRLCGSCVSINHGHMRTTSTTHESLPEAIQEMSEPSSLSAGGTSETVSIGRGNVQWPALLSAGIDGLVSAGHRKIDRRWMILGTGVCQLLSSRYLHGAI